MEQYISKSALVAEIKRRLKVHMESNHGFSARYDELKDILSFLDTLEVKEVQEEPVSKDLTEALRTEYEKGRADAFAEMQKEWNEDDEKRLQSCINILKAKSLMGKVDTANTMWLKSLKQRIGG